MRSVGLSALRCGESCVAPAPEAAGRPRPSCGPAPGRVHRTPPLPPRPAPLRGGGAGRSARSGRVPRPRPAGGVWRARGRRERRRAERREGGQRCRQSRPSSRAIHGRSVGGNSPRERRGTKRREAPSSPLPIPPGAGLGRMCRG